jgi:hypothetical protein
MLDRFVQSISWLISPVFVVPHNHVLFIGFAGLGPGGIINVSRDIFQSLVSWVHEAEDLEARYRGGLSCLVPGSLTSSI